MPREAKINSLTIYLVKAGEISHDAVIKQSARGNHLALENLGTMYYGYSRSNTPTWVKKFFQNRLSEIEGLLFNSTSKAVLITDPVAWESKSFRFAIVFGFGHTMLDKQFIEERFGLKVGLNAIREEGLRKIDRKNLASAPRDASEQLSRPGSVGDFAIDIEQDLVQSVTGYIQSDLIAVLGKAVTGRDSVSLSAPVGFALLSIVSTGCE